MSQTRNQSRGRERIDLDEALSQSIDAVQNLTADIKHTNSNGEVIEFVSTSQAIRILRANFKTNLKTQRSSVSNGGIQTVTAVISIYNHQAKAFVEMANGSYQLSSVLADSQETAFDLPMPLYASEVAMSYALKDLGLYPSADYIPASPSASGTARVAVEQVVETPAPVAQPTPAPKEETPVAQTPVEKEPEPATPKSKPQAEPEVTQEASTKEKAVEKEPVTQTAPKQSKEKDLFFFPPYKNTGDNLTEGSYKTRVTELKQANISELAALNSVQKRLRPKSLYQLSTKQSTSLKNKLNAKSRDYWVALDPRLAEFDASQVKSEPASKPAKATKPAKTATKPAKTAKAATKPAKTAKATTKPAKPTKAATKPAKPVQAPKIDPNPKNWTALDPSLVDQKVLAHRRYLTRNIPKNTPEQIAEVFTGYGLPAELDRTTLQLLLRSLTVEMLQELRDQF